MKITNFAFPAAAISAAAILVWPTDSRAFSTIGGSLSLAQRDQRVFNNFTDPTANDNTTPDANWPGFDGAERAFWKAGSEWGSELHGGNGAGDPVQTVGSGGANFEFAWAGDANGVGGTNDNISSAISGSSGSVLAFTETPIADGWRMRFYEGWTWQDGPGAPSGGQIDIQGVACHELGHSLGLGHSTVVGATMYPSISGTGAQQRSIEADDIAGVQFIYGVKSATKPHISSVGGTTVLTINGSNFSATGNEVWFTSATISATTNYQIVKATNVASTNGGTQITLVVPSGAGPGDVLVKNAAGSTGANLSNAFPADVHAGSPCGNVTVYCTSKLNSQFCSPAINYSGTPSASAAVAFDITASQMLNNKNGLIFYGFAANGAPFEGGTLCVKLPVTRTSVQSSGGSASGTDCSGTYSFDFNALIQGGTDPNLVGGATVYAQYWARDPGDFTGFNTSLSDALVFDICP